MPKSKAKSDTPRGGAGLYIGLAAGGLLLLTCCCGTSGGLGYYFWSKDGLNEKLANAEKKSSPLVGKWEVNHKVQGQEFKRELEFTASGTGALNVTAFKALAGGKNEEMRDRFKYTLIDGNPSILELDTTHAEISGMVLNDRVGKKERMEITFDGDNMTIKSLNPRAIGKGLIYTRVR